MTWESFLYWDERQDVARADASIKWLMERLADDIARGDHAMAAWVTEKVMARKWHRQQIINRGSARKRLHELRGGRQPRPYRKAA